MFFSFLKKLTLFLLCLMVPATTTSQASNNPEVPPHRPPSIPGAGQNDCVSQINNNILITGYFFGLRNTDPRGRPVFVSTKHIPFKVDQHYGFAINVQTPLKGFKWSYEYELPVPFPTRDKYVDDPYTTFSPDMKTATIKEEFKGQRGSLESDWFVVADDNPGRSRMTVFIEGQKACEFIFEVIKK